MEAGHRAGKAEKAVILPSLFHKLVANMPAQLLVCRDYMLAVTKGLKYVIFRVGLSAYALDDDINAWVRDNFMDVLGD